MFDTTHISRRKNYFYRGESLKFSHSDKNKLGTIFVFKNKQGTGKIISKTNCQEELWEEIRILKKEELK